MDFYNFLSPDLKVYWVMALISSLIFVIQTIISFVGGDVFDNSDFDGSHDAGGVSHFFSVRNLVNFLLGAGWGGVCFSSAVGSKGFVVVLAILTGLAFVAIFFGLVQILLKLQKDNTFRLAETLGKTADVYLPIPENRSGKGKIQVSVRGSIHEINAVTAGEKNPTGAKVKITEVIGNEFVAVEKI